MSTETAYVSTPALTVGGSPDDLAVANLLSLSAEEDTAGMAWCEATFRNWGTRRGGPDYLYLSRDVLDFGTDLAVSFGPDGDRHEVFAGRVSALQAEYPADDVARLTVLAEDGLQGLRMKRRTRTFADSSTADIADQIAREHGLTADVGLDGPTRRVSAQLNQSDLAFLRGLARADDGEVWLAGSTLHVARRPDREQDAGDPPRLTYGGNLLSFSVRADLAHQVSSLAVTGWSVADKDAIDESSDSSALGAELGDLTGGSSILDDTLGSRDERVVRAVPLAADDARAWARAAYLEKARRFVCGSGTTGGTPAARVGSRVTLAGLGPMFDGDYYVTRARHTFDLTHGYRTHIDVERAGIGATS
ncbi:phage late control D family protein [Micromonospora sp. NPDC005806]|uniref:phage late control D family protein n=1 Tax=Micromonospora sp. NPDC005806 TaxID=3364234 RepID=UPI00369F3FA8